MFVLVSVRARIAPVQNPNRIRLLCGKADKQFSQSKNSRPTVTNADSSSILQYKTSHGESRIEVIFNNDSFWMPQKRMAELYGVEVNTVNYHLKEIFKSGELEEESVIRKIGIAAS